MTIKSAYDYTIYSLLGPYLRREATNMANIIFKEIFGLSNFEKTDPFQSKDQLEEIITRLKNREPLDYVIGYTNFYGYDFMVNHHVLIPRPETEELVHWILTDYAKDHKQRDVLDIGSGSGCIGLTLKKKNPTFRVFAMEESMDAMNCTRINSKKLRVNAEYFRCDFLDRTIWDAFGTFDIIVSNPPYIAITEKEVMSENTLRYEPDQALYAQSDDPLIFYRHIADFAADHLAESGCIYLELNEFRAKETFDIFKKQFRDIEIKKDMQGKERMMKVSGLRKN